MKLFGKTPDGREAHLFTLENEGGLTADVTDFGATVVRLFAPDRHGDLGDVVLGFDTVEGYARSPGPYFGATIGRCGNRIAHGRFTLDGKTYQLSTNNSPGGIPCSLHGGKVGFDKRLWRTDGVTGDGSTIRFEYHSPAGEEGYPGNLDVGVAFTLTDGNELRIEYTANTDQPTPVNLTNHSYFNLAGEGGRTILGHVLTINAARYLPVNQGLIPTGEIAPVAGTLLDFSDPHTIGDRIERPNEQLRFAGGYDHCFALDSGGGELAVAAVALEPLSGRELEVLTTEPGIQFYSGNFLDGTLLGKNGHTYERRSGFCLETEHFPDAPNHANFPSIILRPGQTYRSTTVYRFRTQ